MASKHCNNNSSRENDQAIKLDKTLNSASIEGKLELIRLLHRCGANVNSQDEQVSSEEEEETKNIERVSLSLYIYLDICL